MFRYLEALKRFRTNKYELSTFIGKKKLQSLEMQLVELGICGNYTIALHSRFPELSRGFDA